MHRPSAGTSIAVVALFVALGGPAEAAKVISGSSIRKESITGKQIKGRSVTLSDLSLGTRRTLLETPFGTIDGARLRDGAVGPADLAPGSVALTHLADNAVTGPKVTNNSLTGEDIAAAAIQSDELADGSVRASEIADGSVDAGEIVDGSVGTDDVGDGRLSGKDLGRFTGSVDLTYGAIAPGACATATTTSLTATNAAVQNLADDVIVATPRTLNDDASVLARAASADQIKITVCNHSAVEVIPGVQRFNYLAIDTNG